MFSKKTDYPKTVPCRRGSWALFLERLTFRKAIFYSAPCFEHRIISTAATRKVDENYPRKLPPLQSFADNWSRLASLPVTACVLIYAWCNYKSKVLQRIVNVSVADAKHCRNCGHFYLLLRHPTNFFYC